MAKKRNDNKNVRIIPIISDYLSVSDRNPLLVILPIILNSDQSDSKEVKEKKENLMKSFGNPLIGFAIGFSGKNGKIILNYRINKVKQAELTRMNEFEEDEVDD